MRQSGLGPGLLLWIVAALLAPALPSNGQADEDQAVKAARQSFEEGRALYVRRHYRKAISYFERAYALRAHFTVLCNIARCYEELNEFVKAKSYYRRCLDEGASAGPMSAEIQQSLKEVTGQQTWISIESPGSGGEVYVDGTPAGKTPTRIAVDPGPHAVEVRRPNATPARATITTLGGEKRTLTLVPVDLRPQPGQGPTAQAKNAVSPAVSSGEHDRRALSAWWFWGSAALTAGLVTVATVFSVQTLARKSDYEDAPTKERYDAFIDRRLLANIFWAGSLAAGASTSTLFFFTRFGSDPERRMGAPRAQVYGLGLLEQF